MGVGPGVSEIASTRQPPSTHRRSTATRIQSACGKATSGADRIITTHTTTRAAWPSKRSTFDARGRTSHHTGPGEFESSSRAVRRLATVSFLSVGSASGVAIARTSRSMSSSGR
jgi:hypothetical protein